MPCMEEHQPQKGVLACCTEQNLHAPLLERTELLAEEAEEPSSEVSEGHLLLLGRSRVA